MKKSFIFLCTAALAVVACNKSVTVVNEEPAEIGFKAVSSAVTKADPEITGSVLPSKDYIIYAAATNVATGIAYFPETAFETSDATVTSSSQYKAATPLYWPVGGANLDFLAYATTAANKANIGTVTWDATLATKGVSFNSWDTYTNQVDLVYAAANNSEKAATTPLVFEHAQALLCFKAKKSGNTDGDIIINSITIKGLEYQGDFEVDNSHNDIIVTWTTAANSAADKTVKGLDSPYTTTTTMTQFTDNLLVPVQARKNFVVNYSIGTNTMEYEYNSERGPWEAGKKYTYELDLNLMEIIFTETVEPWDEVTAIQVPIN